MSPPAFLFLSPPWQPGTLAPACAVRVARGLPDLKGMKLLQKLMGRSPDEELEEIRRCLPAAADPICWDQDSSCIAHSLVNMIDNDRMFTRCKTSSVLSTVTSRLRRIWVTSCTSASNSRKRKTSKKRGVRTVTFLDEESRRMIDISVTSATAQKTTIPDGLPAVL